jgi:hypothetical protein
MMSRYRIRIDELNNGEKRYVAQVMKMEINGGWIKRPRIVWENVNGIIHTTEESALNAINREKEFESQRLNNSVKSTTFKMVE